jgi:hypothetical protein
MKKLLIIVLLVAGAVYAQNKVVTEINGKTPSDKNSIRGAVLLSYDPATNKFYAVQSDTSGNLKIVLPSGAATAANQSTQITRATADSLNFVAIKTLLDSLEADIATIKGNQTDGDQTTQSKSSSNFYTKIGTSVAALDSTTFGFTSRHIGINNDESGSIVDSTTMYISTTSAFSAGTTFKIYAGENLPLDYTCTKLYFKFGSTAKANKSYRFIVN